MRQLYIYSSSFHNTKHVKWESNWSPAPPFMSLSFKSFGIYNERAQRKRTCGVASMELNCCDPYFSQMNSLIERDGEMLLTILRWMGGSDFSRRRKNNKNKFWSQDLIQFFWGVLLSHFIKIFFSDENIRFTNTLVGPEWIPFLFFFLITMEIDQENY